MGFHRLLTAQVGVRSTRSKRGRGGGSVSRAAKGKLAAAAGEEHGTSAADMKPAQTRREKRKAHNPQRASAL